VPDALDLSMVEETEDSPLLKIHNFFFCGGSRHAFTLSPIQTHATIEEWYGYTNRTLKKSTSRVLPDKHSQRKKHFFGAKHHRIAPFVASSGPSY
jgi:hypothetical protein